MNTTTRNWPRVAWIGLLALACTSSHLSCGRSLYQPLSKNTSVEAKKQDAIIALNSDDYATASARLKEVWESEKSDDTATLYAIALLGEGGINLFSLMKDALSLLDKSSSNKAGLAGLQLAAAAAEAAGGSGNSSSSSSSSSSGNGSELLTQIADLVKNKLTDQALLKVKEALGILGQAPSQTSPAIVFQKCLMAGIYASPSLTALLSGVGEIQQQLSQLPTQLGAASGSCTASAATVAQVGQSVTDLITRAGVLSTRLSEVADVLGSCLPAGSASEVNAMTAQVNKLLAAADKGCSIPTTQKLGSYELPACINSFVSAASGDGKAGDKIVSGCEIFLNCSGAAATSSTGSSSSSSGGCF